MNHKKMLSLLTRYKKYIFVSFLIIPVIVLAVFAGTALYNIARASFGSWGDNSLVHACKDARGRVTIVGSGDSCNQNETQVTWLKDVNAGDGLTVTRSSDGATLALAETSNETGWTEAGETWTYDSATTFTVSGDQTAKYRAGAKIKLTQTSVKYFYIVTSSHSSGTTTVTVTGGSDYSLSNASITSPHFSYQATPQGFPDWFNWSPTLVWDGTAPSNVAQSIARFSIIGRTVFLRLKYEYSTAGSNNKVLFFAVPVRPSNAQTSEYNIPGSGYMSTGVAGTAPTISNHVVAQYGQQSEISPGEIYLIIDSAAAIKSVWASLFYEI